MLISTKPDSKGKEAILYRSRQLTEFVWKPLRDIKTYTKQDGKTKFSAGIEYRGMIYSSSEPTDKFIGENISLETFLSLIANPDSALYNKDLGGHNNSWAYSGIVCNGLVRYAMNIRYRYSTKRWQTVPGMRKIADEASYTAEQIELCDVLYAYCKTRKHVALITDILRDEDGKIQKIEVSEAVRPTCVRRQFDVEEFYEKFKLFALWRYDFRDSVPMPDMEEDRLWKQGVPATPSVAVDYGNKSNYREGENVVISAFSDEENEIEICTGDEVIEKITISGSGNVVRKLEAGYYTIRHIKSGECVEFCVTAPKISHTVENGIITIKADPCDNKSTVKHVEFREKTKSELKEKGKDDENTTVAFYSDDCASLSKVEVLNSEEKESGIITREIPDDAGNYKVYFENEYGIWTHRMIKI